MAAATLAGAQAEAMKAAASNTSTGPMMAFAGMNMATQAGGMDANSLYAMGAAQQAAAQAQPQQAAQQAAAQPQQTAQSQEGWTYSCGKTGNTGKFCSNCGSPRPSAPKKIRCDKCGWEPTPGMPTPKFCPECGDPINDADMIG